MLAEIIINKLKKGDKSVVNDMYNFFLNHNNMNQQVGTNDIMSVDVNKCILLLEDCLSGTNLEACSQTFQNINMDNISFKNFNKHSALKLFKNLGLDITDKNALYTWLNSIKDDDLKQNIETNKKLIHLLGQIIDKTVNRRNTYYHGGHRVLNRSDLKKLYNNFKNLLETNNKTIEPKDDNYINFLLYNFKKNHKKLDKLALVINNYMNYVNLPSSELQDRNKELITELQTNPISIEFLEKLTNKYQNTVSQVTTKSNEFRKLLLDTMNMQLFKNDSNNEQVNKMKGLLETTLTKI